MITGSSRSDAIVLTGPTASGKTELLEALSRRGALFFQEGRVPRFEVISADSMQAYRGMDIGTAKPDRELLELLPHHLIDIKNPDEQYTAGEFAMKADALCAQISGRGRIPVISGGTGFYIRTLICGTPESPPADPEIRKSVERDLELSGSSALRAELASADPASAARIHENDLYRLTRAIEILRASGKPPSFFAPSARPREDRRYLVIGVQRERTDLVARIDRRVDDMFARGLAEEVGRLVAAGYTLDSPGMVAIGYKEFFASDTVSGKIADLIKLHTRQYAKRQMTFLRALPGIEWIQPKAELLASKIIAFQESFLSSDSRLG